MTKYEYLFSLINRKNIITMKIKTLFGRAEEIENRTFGLSGSPITGMPHAPSGEQDKMGAAVVEKVDFEERHGAEMSELTKELVYVNDMISDLLMSSLDTEIWMVLVLHYVANLPLDDIAAEFDIHARKLAEKGLSELEQQEI